MSQERAHFSIDKDVGLHGTDLLVRALDSMPGVSSVKIDKGNSCIAVDYNSSSVSQEELQAKIEILGYPIEHS